MPEHARNHPDEAICEHRFRLPLERQRQGWLEFDGVAHEGSSRLAEEHFTRSCGRLEPGGDIDRVACREPLLGASDDLARVDADPELERHAVVTHELLVEVAESSAQVVRGTHSAQSVVLVQAGHAEDGHHRVADELLDRAAVALDYVASRLEVAGHHAPQALWIELFAEFGRAGHVAEHDCHRLACLTLGRTRLERRPALGAEARRHTAVVPTAGTEIHLPRLRLRHDAVQLPQRTSFARTSSDTTRGLAPPPVSFIT